MIIGLIKEIKPKEFRVGLTPATASEYVYQGHTVLVEHAAGEGSGFSDEDYLQAGCEILSDKKDIFDRSDMIIKVKEPQPSEYEFLRENQILYTYLHLAADKLLTEVLIQKKVTGIAYEAIEDKNGALPLLRPMSEIAGRLAVQEGAKYLEKHYGGRGILLGGVPGVSKGKVVIIGGGVVGANACKIAVGLGANVSILDVSASRLAYLDDIFENRITTLYSTRENILREISSADLVIGAVLIPGRKAPHIIRAEDLKLMPKGAVIVDVAIDQGGCIETAKPTTHENPTYVVDGIVHYCVSNMPGAVALTSTRALTSVTLPYGLAIASQGLQYIIQNRPDIRKGIHTHAGQLTSEAVGSSLGLPYQNLISI